MPIWLFSREKQREGYENAEQGAERHNFLG
jgi:hypothetical protein